MKKIFVCLAVSIFLASCGHTPAVLETYSSPDFQISHERIAVLLFECSDRAMGGTASDEISAILIKKGFRVADRSLLSFVLSEQGLSKPAGPERTVTERKLTTVTAREEGVAVAAATETKEYLSRIGKVANANIIIFGNVKMDKNTLIDLSFKMIEVKTGDTVMGAEYSLERNKRNGEPDTFHARTIKQVCSTLVEQLIPKKK